MNSNVQLLNRTFHVLRRPLSWSRSPKKGLDFRKVRRKVKVSTVVSKRTEKELKPLKTSIVNRWSVVQSLENFAFSVKLLFRSVHLGAEDFLKNRIFFASKAHCYSKICCFLIFIHNFLYRIFFFFFFETTCILSDRIKPEYVDTCCTWLKHYTHVNVQRMNVPPVWRTNSPLARGKRFSFGRVLFVLGNSLLLDWLPFLLACGVSF